MWDEISDDTASNPPAVKFLAPGTKAPPSNQDTYIFNRSAVIPETEPKTSKARTRSKLIEEQVKAIGELLASFGLLDGLSRTKQERLLKAIYQILSESEE